jgi:hypothetical protein
VPYTTAKSPPPDHARDPSLREVALRDRGEFGDSTTETYRTIVMA